MHTWLMAVLALGLCVDSSVVAQAQGPLHDAQAVALSADFETIDQGQLSHFRCGDFCFAGVDMLIKDQATWEWFWEQHTSGLEPPPDLPEVDFGTEMVMVTILGIQTSCCESRIEVFEIEVGAWGLRVFVEDDETGGDLPVLTNPYHIIKLDRIQVPSIVFEHQKPE